VQLHGASAAQRRLATDVRAGESHHFVQVMNQEKSRLYFMGIRSAIDAYVNGFCHDAHFRQRVPAIIEDTKNWRRKLERWLGALLSGRPIPNLTGLPGLLRFLPEEVELSGGRVAIHLIVPNLLIALAEPLQEASIVLR